MNTAAAGNVQPPLECQACIDAVLGSLAYRYREAIDPLLDLKLDAARKRNPGNCVQTYFWLMDRLPSAAKAEIGQIRAWLEQLIEVVAFKANREPFFHLPLELDHTGSLEEYCTNVMRQFRCMTAHAPFDLELQFAFRA